jgi:hypothetical protein
VRQRTPGSRGSPVAGRHKLIPAQFLHYTNEQPFPFCSSIVTLDAIRNS